MTEYMFVRAEGFYFLSLRDDEDAQRNAECNPGTIAVTECLTGKKVWPSAPSATQAESSTPTTNSSAFHTPAPDAC